MIRLYNRIPDNICACSSNTNFWNVDNFYLYDSDEEIPDPEGILAFLVEELQRVESAGFHAILIGHIHPSRVFPAQSLYYNEILQRYNSTIVGQYYGDSHLCDFTIAYSSQLKKDSSTAMGVSFIGGSLTPLGGTNNPGFRVYELDERTGELWDWHDYHTDLNASRHFHESPKWEHMYSARQVYGDLLKKNGAAVDNEEEEESVLDPSFWHRVSKVLESSRDAFRTYVIYKYRGSAFSVHQACRTALCHRWTICDMRRSINDQSCLGDPGPDTMLKPLPLIPEPTSDFASSSSLSLSSSSSSSVGFKGVIRGILGSRQ